MEEDIAGIRKSQNGKSKVIKDQIFTDKCGRKRLKKEKKGKKKKHEINIFSHRPVSQLRTWTAQQEGG